MKISVVIRTRDKERHFDDLLQSLAHQTVQASELIIVNNYSSEEKRRLFENDLYENVRRIFCNRQIGLKLIALSNKEFSHPYSTNLGVDTAENELVCITNAHSLPISHRWLQEGIRNFSDRRVAGVSGFFVPHTNEAIMGRLDTLIYYLAQRAVSRQDWFSTINGIVNKSLWKAYPFDENLPRIIPETRKYGLEDYDWGKEMIARGYRIVVHPLFSVFHSHENGLNEIGRNVRNYFVYREIQQKINLLKRPRESFSKVFSNKPQSFVALNA